MIHFDFKGKTALVTGSTQGIGYAIAKALVDAGAKVFVHGARSLEKAQKAAEKMGAYKAVVADLSDLNETKKLHDLTGDVDFLILNASVQFRNPPETVTDEEMEQQLAVNFKSSFLLINAYMPHMKEQGFGRVVTIGSVQQFKPHAQMPVYAASKCALVSLIENLAKQWSKYGVTFNNVAPGVIATPRNEDALSDPAYKQKILDGIPCGYIGESEDLAAIVLLLLSDEGKYIVGADIPVDGGMRL